MTGRDITLWGYVGGERLRFGSRAADCDGERHQFSTLVLFNAAISPCTCGRASYRYDEVSERGIIASAIKEATGVKRE